MTRFRPTLRALSACVVASALTGPATASASAGATQQRPYAAGRVIVSYHGGTSPSERARVQRSAGARTAAVTAPQRRVLRVPDDVPVALRRLRRHPEVADAVPVHVAHAAGLVPNDPGPAGTPAGWQLTQWNFLPGTGVDAPDAWANLAAAGAPGGRGVRIAVVDSGVAFENRGAFRRSPDFTASQFVPGHDFVDRDAQPDDVNGHGTFVAGLIGERTNNGVALTGLAYGARIMPVRVLDRDGYGMENVIGAGIRYAVRHGAQIVNLSIEFDPTDARNGVQHASDIPDIASAVRYAQRKRVLVVAAGGNDSFPGKPAPVAFPAALPGVVSVGAVTEHGCAADYSNEGSGLDLVAPGGGSDAEIPSEADRCRPQDTLRDVTQLTLRGASRRSFSYGRENGTSFSAPHVSAAAALVIASRILGGHPSPARVLGRLQRTARDLGPPGADPRYGAGALDAAAATTPPRASPAR